MPQNPQQSVMLKDECMLFSARPMPLVQWHGNVHSFRSAVCNFFSKDRELIIYFLKSEWLSPFYYKTSQCTKCKRTHLHCQGCNQTEGKG